MKAPVLRAERGLWMAQWRDLEVTAEDPNIAQSASAEPPSAIQNAITDLLHTFKPQVLPQAIKAASLGCREVLGWVAAPPEEDWIAIALHLDQARRPWVAVQDYSGDEYMLWIVGFDPDLRPRRLRRAPDRAGRGQAPLPDRGEEVFSFT